MSANATKKLKRLLVISWALPPILSARSIQVGRMMRELAAQGWEIDVICADAKTLGPFVQLDPLLEAYYVKGYAVHRLPSAFFRNWSVLIRRFFPLIRTLPDNEIGWVRKAKKFGKQLLLRKNFDVMLSFGQPWSSHLLALNLHTEIGLPWIAHFSDPWADNPYYRDLTVHQMEKMKRLEALVIHEADKIIFTNQHASNLVMKKYPTRLRAKASILPHAFDQYQSDSKPHSDEEGNKLKFVHMGSLYGLRNLKKFIIALGELNRSTPIASQLRVQFVGRVKHQSSYYPLIVKYGLSDSIEFLGARDFRHSQLLASAADVLILIDAPAEKESLFLPSKLIEYLKFKKPILGITPLRGASADLLRRIDCPVAAPDDIGAIKKEIEALINKWRKGQLHVSANFNQAVRTFHVRYVVSKLADLLVSVVS